MRLVTSLLLAVGLLAGAAACESRICKSYKSCCTAVKSYPRSWKLLQGKTRCYRYRQASTDRQCQIELSRAVAELNGARLAAPAECKP